MIILTLRTDKPEAEFGLYEDQNQLGYIVWPAHRLLAETIHSKINELLQAHGKSLSDINGILVFKGPGSFTGLRIGFTVANALSYSLQVPVVSDDGDGWLVQGVNRLLKKENEHVAMPEYGALPNITAPKH